MAQKAPAPPDPKSVATSNNQAKPRPKAPAGPAPFEPSFWTRYSPHYEFPLSGATSLSLHILAFVGLIAAGWFVAIMLEKSKLEVDTVTFAGGGGNPEGEGKAPGDRPPLSGKENVDDAPKNEPVKPPGPLPPDQLKKPIVDPIPLIMDDSTGRTIDQANEAAKKLSILSKEARSKLWSNLEGPGKGQGGAGSGGGLGTGKDKGEGAFTGPGKSKFTSRQQRVLRWVMRFNTLNGNDYRRQLSGLGAILAFPQPDGGYMVYRDLNQKPAKGEIEDIASIKRIFWVDEKKDSIRSLSEAMGVPVPDSPIVAFFPEKLEAELLRKELSYRGKKEEDIDETTFKINVRGGSFVPEVVDQRLK
jgi:hypothetical protein